MFSIGFTTDEARAAATDIYYLRELDRQAEIAAKGIHVAVMRGRESQDPQDPKVWGALQNTLFATICIARLLKPAKIKGTYPGMDKASSQAFADDRGKRLRDALDIEDDCHILDVTPVRNAYEHYDEHFDQHLVKGAECFADWYITDQNVLKSPPTQGNPSKAVGIRVFFAPGGVLYFEEKELFLFELEVELLQLRVKIAQKIREAQEKVTGRAQFGGQILEPLMSPQKIERRFQDWQHARADALEALAEEQAKN